MKGVRVHLLRHGQVEGHENKRYNGQGDTPLTPLGQRQTRELAECFTGCKLSAIYSSDLQRCRELADQLAAGHNLQPGYLSALRELHIGDWEGRPWAELQADYPDLWQARLEDIVNVAPPGGESVQQLADRVRPVIRTLLAAHAGEEVVIVGHGALNRVILLDAIGASLAQVFHIEQDYCCHNIIDYSDADNAVVKRLNG
ncbi:MAG: alpha-ribazole phosphatase [Desulfuromonas sp.]|nr:MAG: alpha-ribazole phosphatase [Desulfuromonas sp.]